jgi:hypothetical protein
MAIEKVVALGKDPSDISRNTKIPERSFVSQWGPAHLLTDHVFRPVRYLQNMQWIWSSSLAEIRITGGVLVSLPPPSNIAAVATAPQHLALCANTGACSEILSVSGFASSMQVL